jgi:hypothetical protein
MMKNRISISILTLLFLVSTTGMPIWSHYCEMMGKRSINECEMCKAEIEKIEPSCCSEEISDNDLKFSSEKSNCCVDEFDYKKIEDNFFQTVSSNLITNNLIIAELQLTTLESQDEEKYSQQTNYDLPPPKFGKQLLNTIHQLKLDLPFC